MSTFRDETSTALLGVIEDEANRMADYLVKAAALWKVNSQYDRGYVAAHQQMADTLRRRALAAAQRVGELRAEQRMATVHPIQPAETKG